MLWFGWHAYMAFIIGPWISRDPVLRELEVEGIILVPIIFLGWLPAGIFAWISLSISYVLQRFFPGLQEILLAEVSIRKNPDDSKNSDLGAYST